MLLGLLLLVIGFVVGNGYHTAQEATTEVGPDSRRRKPVATLSPLVKGLRASPDDRLLAFTGVYEQSQRASRFLLDLQTHHFSAVDTPRGWQDYITQWSQDSRTILFEREKIPRPVADASAGIYQERVRTAAPSGEGDARPQQGEPKPLTQGLAPNGEKVIAGFWTPAGKLVVKTRREPKSLYEVQDGKTLLLDSASGNYMQSRAIHDNGKTVYYVVRDVPGQNKAVALYQVRDGRAQRLSDVLKDVEWVYLDESARWMIVCRQDGNGIDWVWTLYQVMPAGARPLKSGPVTGDVISVYWSPDLKRVLGSGGKSLWIVDIPSLRVHRLGAREDWNADDASWLSRRSAVIVAASGSLWEVTVPEGRQREIWKFPPQYWR